MKLSEIRILASPYLGDANLTADQIAQANDAMKGGTKIASTQGGKLEVFRKGRFFSLKKLDGTLCGWIILDETSKHFEFDLIYFFEQYRQGPYVPALIHAVKAALDKPIYFPADSVLYKDGAALLKALTKRTMAKVTVVHTDGTSTALKHNDIDSLLRTDSLIIEDVLPLIFKIPVDLLGTKKEAVVSFFEGDEIIGPATDKIL
jgi:hypothetical protein